MKAKKGSEFLEKLSEARKRYVPGRFDGVAEMYCETESCPAREVEITIKEIKTRIEFPLRCPCCRNILKCHQVRLVNEALAPDRRITLRLENRPDFKKIVEEIMKGLPQESKKLFAKWWTQANGSKGAENEEQ